MPSYYLIQDPSLSITVAAKLQWNQNQNTYTIFSITKLFLKMGTISGSLDRIGRPDEFMLSLTMLDEVIHKTWQYHRAWYFGHTSEALITLQWRQNERDGDSDHQPHDCVLNRLFGQIKENIKAPRHWPLCGEFTGDRGILRTNGQ